MFHYRGLLLLSVIAVFLLTFFLQPGEARRSDSRRDSRINKEKTFRPSVNALQQQGRTELDAARVEALRSLYEQMKSGAPVSDLEAALLQRFTDGDDITFVEADTIISRALYDFYVRRIRFSELTKEQQSLLRQYQAETVTALRRIDNLAEPILMLDSPPGFAPNAAALPNVASASDTCADAIPLSLNIPVAGSSTDPTVNDYQLPAASACFPAGHTVSTASGRDVVYSFTAPSAGQYSFRAWQYVSTGTSNVVAYVGASCPAATPGTPVTVTTCLAASNLQSSTGGEEINCLSLAAGQQVFFYIDEATLGAGGTFYALVEACGPMETEPNNTPATANALACGIQGQVNPATEADFYSIGTPAAGSRLFAMVDASTAGSSADVDLRVNTSTDTVEFDDLDGDVEFGVSGFAPIISGTIATGAPLFYQVDRFGAAPTGNAFPYRLYSVVQPSSANATPESEPNDTTANASFAANNYFSGALSGPAPSTDADLYSFPATAGDLIMLIVDGDPLRNNTPVDTRLELLDSTGATLVDVDGSGATVGLDNANPPGLFETVPTFPSEGLLFRAPTTGTYYARVSTNVTGVTGVGDYLLSITKNCTIGGGVLPPSTFPNDTCAGAIPLTLNIPVAGGTTGVTNNDYQLSGSACFTGTGNTPSTASGRDVVYSFTAPAAGQYSFRAWQYTSTGTSNAVVYLANTCPAATPGTPVTVSCFAAANFQSSTGGEEINCVSLAAGQQVFFYIDEATFGAGGTFYALVEACGPMETEPNNTPATANALACGIQGQVNPATEADFYSIGTPAAGSRLFAMVDASTAGPSADVDLRVNSTTDTIEYDDLDSDVEFGVSGFAPIIAGTMATGAPLFYQVDRFGAAPTGNAFPYRLYSVVQPSSANATPESEPNDTTANADFAANNYFSGALAGPAPSTDADLYFFPATAGDLIMLIVDGDPLRNNTPVDTRLELLDSAGVTLVDVNGSGSTVTLDNANPPGLFETVPTFPSEGLLFRAPTSGVYYARVTAAVTGATGVGDYLLSITKNCANPPTAANGTVSGRITTSDGEPVSGTVISLSGSQSRKTITDSNGNYRFDNIETNGFYTVTPSRANYSFSPANRSFSSIGNRTDAAFTAVSSADAANPLDTAEYFVRQLYVDFLGREPDEGGFNYWSDRILECDGDTNCVASRRRDVAAAFFISNEFQNSGYFVYRLYKGAFGAQPTFAQYVPDRNRLIGGNDLEASRLALADDFVRRGEFQQAYPDSLTNEQFVNKLYDTAALFPYTIQRQLEIDKLNNNVTRSEVLQDLIDDAQFVAAEYNPAFVLTEYFSFLRRNPDAGGYEFWLDVLNNREPNNYSGMVCSFVTSAEYQHRFSSVVTHTNAECSR